MPRASFLKVHLLSKKVLGPIERFFISLTVKKLDKYHFGKALKHLRIRYPEINCKAKKAFVF